MNRNLISSLVVSFCLAVILVTPPAKAQTSDVGLSVRVNPTTTSPGLTVGVFGLVTNNTASKTRTNVTISSLSPCGLETVLGSSRITLNPGQTIQVTVSYPIPPDACTGTYTIEISSTTQGQGKGGSAQSTSNTSAFLQVQ